MRRMIPLLALAAAWLAIAMPVSVASAPRRAPLSLDLQLHQKTRPRHTTRVIVHGDPDTVRHKVAVLHEHCAAEGRDPAQVAVTHLGTARVLAPGEARAGPGAATAEEHVGRYRELAEAGVQTAIVGLGDADGPESVRRFAEVIAAFAEPVTGRA